MSLSSTKGIDEHDPAACEHQAASGITVRGPCFVDAMTAFIRNAVIPGTCFLKDGSSLSDPDRLVLVSKSYKTVAVVFEIPLRCNRGVYLGIGSFCESGIGYRA